MTLSTEARERVADLVALQPTKNAELCERWGLEDGAAVHRYLEDELGEYYYRDEDSRIRATPAAVALVGGEPESVSVSRLGMAVLEVLAGPEGEPSSVVATLHALRETGHEPEPDVDAVRSTLRGLEDRGLVEEVRRTVPTFRLAAPREELDVTVADEGAGADEPTAER